MSAPRLAILGTGSWPHLQLAKRLVVLLACAGQCVSLPVRATAAEAFAQRAPQWQEIELELTAARDTANPYTDVEAWVDFTHDDGTRLRRPAFWDGGRTFRVRFASTRPSGTWRWSSFDRDADPGLRGRSGTLTAAAPESSTIFARHGFWSIPPGGRNLVHADGRARLLVADTAWALPWRATPEQVETYARDREAKGFNAALLMTVQPDRTTKGPRSRTAGRRVRRRLRGPPRRNASQAEPRVLPGVRPADRDPPLPRHRPRPPAGVPRLWLEGRRRGGQRA